MEVSLFGAYIDIQINRLDRLERPLAVARGMDGDYKFQLGNVTIQWFPSNWLEYRKGEHAHVSSIVEPLRGRCEGLD